MGRLGQNGPEVKLHWPFFMLFDDRQTEQHLLTSCSNSFGAGY